MLYNYSMNIAPRQDWTIFRTLARDADAAWMRGLSVAERFDLYADLFGIVWEAQRNQGIAERLEKWNWDRKLASRRRLADAYSKLDELRRERAASHEQDLQALVVAQGENLDWDYCLRLAADLGEAVDQPLVSRIEALRAAD
jgi:hypothetical protein